MRGKIAAFSLLASLIGMGTAGAAECPPSALGVSRTITVDPSEHPRIGSMQYNESLPLRDREVVLTFDDGPLPPHTARVLDLLASDCVKATFFLVGRMARAYPAMVKRIAAEGHTVANHSQSHPFTFHRMSPEQAKQEVEDGFTSIRAALDDPTVVSPFFRIPGLLRGPGVEQYLAAHKDMIWSVDVVADDWTHIGSKEIARRAINRLEARGKGILLLHDIHATTAAALPEILQELKARGFKIVHVVPATAERPKTVTEPELWAVRRTPEQKLWPASVPIVGLENPEPMLSAPSPASFGIERFGPVIKVAMAQTFDSKVVNDGITAWPAPVVYAVPADAEVLPVPGAHNFRYSRPFRLGAPPERPKVAAKRSAPARQREAAQQSYGWFGAPPAGSRPKSYGHQLNVARPQQPTSLNPPQFR
jgi:peptidoglycan-N-acetylglucosamine deacetylase